METFRVEASDDRTTILFSDHLTCSITVGLNLAHLNHTRIGARVHKDLFEKSLSPNFNHTSDYLEVAQVN